MNALLVLVIVATLGKIGKYASRADYPFDFRAFYCGAKIVLHHGDPYTVEPLRSCESALTPVPVQPLPSYAIPAPLPGYDFVLLAPLGALPPYPAKLVFLALELASLTLLATCLWGLTRLPFAVTLAASFFGVGYVAVDWGQLPPFAISMLAVSALALVREKYIIAGVAVSMAMVQPQLSLAAILAVLVFVPRARIATIASCLGLGALSLAVMGFHRTVEYLTVVRVHAAAEISHPGQFSATWIAHALGASDRLALAIGTASSIATLVASLYIVYRARLAGDRGSAVVLLPAAFAVLGGTYIHPDQIDVAVLAGMVQRHAMTRWIAGLGIALLAFPWDRPLFMALPVVTALAIVSRMAAIWVVVRYIATPFAATLSIAVVGGYFLFLRAIYPHGEMLLALPPPTAADPSQLNSVYWHDIVGGWAAQISTPFLWLAKLQIWLGLALIIAAVTLPLLARREARVAARSIVESA